MIWQRASSVAIERLATDECEDVSESKYWARRFGLNNTMENMGNMGNIIG